MKRLLAGSPVASTSRSHFRCRRDCFRRHRGLSRAYATPFGMRDRRCAPGWPHLSTEYGSDSSSGSMPGLQLPARQLAFMHQQMKRVLMVITLFANGVKAGDEIHFPTASFFRPRG